MKDSAETSSVVIGFLSKIKTIDNSHNLCKRTQCLTICHSSYVDDDEKLFYLSSINITRLTLMIFRIW